MSRCLLWSGRWGSDSSPGSQELLLFSTHRLCVCVYHEDVWSVEWTSLHDCFRIVLFGYVRLPMYLLQCRFPHFCSVRRRTFKWDLVISFRNIRYMLWHIGLLPGNDHKLNIYTTAVAKHLLCKQRPFLSSGCGAITWEKQQTRTQ